MKTETKPASRVQKLIAKRVDELASRKNQRDIAREAGYDNPNMISMLKAGQTKLALDRVPAMARALEVDRSHLFRLALEQFFSGAALNDIVEMTGVMTENEREILSIIRQATSGSDPKLTDDLRERLVENFQNSPS